MEILNYDQPVIRSYSTHIRFLQASIQVIIAYWIWDFDNDNCSSRLTTVGLPLSVIMFFFNAAPIALIKCTKYHSHKLFKIGFIINLIFCLILMIFGLLAMGQRNSCANNKVLFRFVGLQSLIGAILGVQTLFTKFDFAIRYTNAPGNLVWVFLFYSFSWSQHFKTYYFPTGVIFLIITISTLSVHLVFLMSNFRENIKRIIFFIWFGGLILMGIGQILGFVGYLGGGDDSQADAIARKLAQTFLIINVIDALFWIYGLFSLRVHIGDTIHQQAFGIREKDQRNLIY